jgi:hypothetical protein
MSRRMEFLNVSQMRSPRILDFKLRVFRWKPKLASVISSVLVAKQNETNS